MAGFDAYEDHDAVGLAGLVKAGEVHPTELVEASIARIEARDGAINAVVGRMFDHARDRAAGALPDGPLKGVPYLLKDLHADLAGVPTTGSTRLLRKVIPTSNTTMVDRLLAAGLVVVGKTNTPELGIMGITEPKLHGPTRNPWNPAHTSGGSSGGSGAAVAARYVPAAHASDGGGSIRIPASHNGLVGLKPTRARTPLGPHTGEAWGGMTVEHALTRTVRDCAALLDATAGPEAGAPYCAPHHEGAWLDEVGRDPGTLRIAVSTRSLLAGENAPEAVAAVEAAAALARDLGHQVSYVDPDLAWDTLRMAYFTFVAAGVSEDVADTARRAGTTPKPGDFEPTTWLFRKIGGALTAADLERARRDAHAAGFALARFFADHDVWLTSTCARPPAAVGELYPAPAQERMMAVLRTVGTRRILLTALESMASDAIAATPNTQVANLTGIPALSLPLHWTEAGLPVGTQWMAPFGREDVLFRLAAQLEQARPWRERRPELARVG